ncbi:MAG: hypothetical protein H0T09_00140 [Actinobacteria bacterium]|nr:hypothetical protein [Actinomycetota bacterium]
MRLDELRASRARIVEAGDAERRRLERNLHDGAQQRLVSLSLSLRLAEPRPSTWSPKRSRTWPSTRRHPRCASESHARTAALCDEHLPKAAPLP